MWFSITEDALDWVMLSPSGDHGSPSPSCYPTSTNPFLASSRSSSSDALSETTITHANKVLSTIISSTADDIEVDSPSPKGCCYSPLVLNEARCHDIIPFKSPASPSSCRHLSRSSSLPSGRHAKSPGLKSSSGIAIAEVVVSVDPETDPSPSISLSDAGVFLSLAPDRSALKKQDEAYRFSILKKPDIGKEQVVNERLFLTRDQFPLPSCDGTNDSSMRIVNLTGSSSGLQFDTRQIPPSLQPVHVDEALHKPSKASIMSDTPSIEANRVAKTAASELDLRTPAQRKKNINGDENTSDISKDDIPSESGEYHHFFH